ncbi:glycine cleavage system aminomethyltransferase GcvT [Imhoffiella purpurea]|uniref:Aminomethyltransferase n=1 Tax=Imhoffiella purpurea TaxID=1249627 RepID=W9V8Q4_9GAMM|nr:glycine cleavage system aminomethyltransferase GcvT [Imhoffiella purpurea]EXJ13261.1 Aminomethyltransferase (glycine cleavage system T protein) [Imhoffiella purpurea]
MGRQTPLFSEHERLGARIVPFGGWDMPLHYGSQIEEHHAVRRAAGMFDVSHMRPVDIEGEDAQTFLRRLLANDVAKLQSPGKALYSCMLNPAGGVVDDLIVYARGPNRYRLVVNAATADNDIAWMREHARDAALEIRPRDDLAMIAIQGPEARSRTEPLLPEAMRAEAMRLEPFFAADDERWFVGRTGYTGEDGFEIMLPAEEAADLWSALAEAGIRPCGLGARDTLRLEAGMNLYGQDMDDEIGPLESGLGWTLAWAPEERDFIGREALSKVRQDPNRRVFVGLLLTGRGVIRSHQKVLAEGREVGEITSGGFSPTLERSIALARVQPGMGETCEVEIRGKPVAARILKPPFVRHGRIRIDL